jgi:phage shock protein E
MKKTILVVLLLMFISGCSSPIESKGETLTSQQAYTASQENNNILIVDVRTPSEYAEGHIPSSVNLPLDTLKGVAATELPNKDEEIYVVCRSGNRSSQAQNILESLGYTNISDIGSVFDWPEELNILNP